MPLSNYERMIQLATKVFDVKNDPDQLDVNQEVIERLKKIHPATVAEYDNGKGPVAWVLVIPTTTEHMNKFIQNKISEKELFDLTRTGETYEAIYLCSAMVLEEYRRKGIAKRLSMDAIKRIQKDHPIKFLFAWPFSREGDLSCEAIAQATSLPLSKRVEIK